MAKLQSLWSPQIKADILSPKQILAVQASALTSATKGMLVGELTESQVDDGQIRLSLDMAAPALKYKQRILTASYTPSRVYPAQIDADLFRPKGLAAITGSLQAVQQLHLAQGKKPESRADSDEEFISLVERVRQSSEVVSIAQSLVAQANEAMSQADYVGQVAEVKEDHRAAFVRPKIETSAFAILDSEVFVRTIAATNATGWGIDDFDITGVRLDEKQCIVDISYSASGQQDVERTNAGDRVDGAAEAVIGTTGEVEYRNITAEIVYDDEE